MTAPVRALVQRHGRKQHFATLAPGASAWIPVCDVADVPVFGAVETGRDSWDAWLRVAQSGSPDLCRRCRTPLLVASLALTESRSARVDALEQENRRLRAEVARWTTAALDETRKAGEYLRDHVVFRRRSGA